MPTTNAEAMPGEITAAARGDTLTGEVFLSSGTTSVLGLKDGRLMTSACNRACFSGDGGNTWSYVEPTHVASSYSPAMLRRIPTTGDLLCIWNNVGADEIRNGFRRAAGLPIGLKVVVRLIDGLYQKTQTAQARALIDIPPVRG